MTDFNFNKYIKSNPLLKEAFKTKPGGPPPEDAGFDDGGEIVTIELDMSWDESNPEEDQAAKAAFKKFNIDVVESNRTGTYEVTGEKGNILDYLRSEFYDMDEETIHQYYPELLDGELEETSGIGNYVQPEKMFGSPDYIDSDEYDYMTSDETDDAEKSGKLSPSNAKLGPDEEIMEGNVTAVDNFIDKLKSTTKKMAMKLKDSELEDLKSGLQKWADSGFDTTS